MPKSVFAHSLSVTLTLAADGAVAASSSAQLPATTYRRTPALHLPATADQEFWQERWHKYSPQTLAMCDRAVARAREASAVPLRTVEGGGWERVRSLVERLARRRDHEGRVAALVELAHAIGNAPARTGGYESPTDGIVAEVEEKLLAAEQDMKLRSPEDIGLPWLVIDPPADDGVKQAKVLQTILAGVWLRLAEYWTGSILDEPFIANDASIFQRADERAQYAATLVSPWCQPEPFAMIHMHHSDLAAAGGLRAITTPTNTAATISRVNRSILTDHLAEIGTITTRLDADVLPAVAARTVVSRQRNTRWASQVEAIRSRLRRPPPRDELGEDREEGSGAPDHVRGDG